MVSFLIDDDRSDRHEFDETGVFTVRDSVVR